jgi:hypothetical protein
MNSVLSELLGQVAECLRRLRSLLNQTFDFEEEQRLRKAHPLIRGFDNSLECIDQTRELP